MAEILDVPTEPAIKAQAGAPGTEPTGWMPLTDDLRNNAPETVKKLLEAKKWGTVEDVFKGYDELEKFTGVGKHLVIPESDDAEGWNNVWNQLGRPENPDGYTLESHEALDDELVSNWKKYAHSEGYTQKQMEGAVQFQLDIISSINKAENDQRETNTQLLKDKWKETYPERITGARMTADSLGIYQTLEAKGLASDPVIIEMLDTIRSRTTEGVITPPTPPSSAKDPLVELEEIKKSEAFTKKFHPQHKAVMKRFMELNQIIANTGLAPKRIQGG